MDTVSLNLIIYNMFPFDVMLNKYNINTPLAFSKYISDFICGFRVADSYYKIGSC